MSGDQVDIEDRAAKWVESNELDLYEVDTQQQLDQALISAYLAGVSQARADEELHRRQQHGSST